VTSIPNAPDYLKGVMNLRGTVVPVVDLRRRFRMEPVECTTFTVVIVVTVGARVMGLMVDAVSEVLDVAPGDVEPTPDFGGQVDGRLVSGLAKTGDRLVVLLDIERVVGGEDLAATPA
jgi:purine-binding chemotaxis protein CheW